MDKDKKMILDYLDNSGLRLVYPLGKEGLLPSEVLTVAGIREERRYILAPSMEEFENFGFKPGLDGSKDVCIYNGAGLLMKLSTPLSSIENPENQIRELRVVNRIPTLFDFIRL